MSDPLDLRVNAAAREREKERRRELDEVERFVDPKVEVIQNQLESITRLRRERDQLREAIIDLRNAAYDDSHEGWVEAVDRCTELLETTDPHATTDGAHEILDATTPSEEG